MADISAFGSEVATKYKKALTAKRLVKLEMTPEVKGEIIALIKDQMAKNPEQPQTQYLTKVLGNPQTYDVMVVETPQNLEIRQFPYGPGASVRWRGERMTLFVDEKLVDSLEADTAYVVVGRYKLVSGKGRHEGRQFNNFNVQGLITMAEIEAYDGTVASKKQEEKEINEKVAEHQGPVAEKDVTPEPTQ